MIKQTKMEKNYILSRFLNQGHHLTSASFNLIYEYINLTQEKMRNKKLQLLIQKINEMTILNTKSQKTKDKLIQQCLISLQYKNGKMNYLQIINQKYKKCMLYINPYQYCTQQYFIQKPQKYLFEFRPQQKIKMYMDRFKKIKESSKDILKFNQGLIGILFQKYNSLERENNYFLQNQSTEIKINLSQIKSFDSYFICGCTYIAKGKYVGKNLVLYITQLLLPNFVKPLRDLSRNKYEQILKIADSYKQNDNQNQYRQEKLGIKYFTEEESKAPVIIIGNITLNYENLNKVEEIIQKLVKVQCVILLLNDEKHSVFDFKNLKTKVFIIPHINASGPQILPKIPITKQNFINCQILTNPARLTIAGRNLILTNYQLTSSLSTNNINFHNQNLSNESIIKSIGNFIFSQCNVGIGFDTFWEQNQYLDIFSQNWLFSSDLCCPQGHYNFEKGAFCSVGNFDRDRSFISYYSTASSKHSIQQCNI